MAEASSDGGPDDALATVRRVLWWALVALVAILAVTGVVLALRYQPTAEQAWPQLDPVDGEARTSALAATARTVHRAASLGAVLVGLAFAAVAAADAGRQRRGLAPAVGLVLALVAGLVTAALSGPPLAWDQLALRAVTVGSDIAGFRWLLGDDVVFVLVDGSEVATTTMRRIAAVHLAAALVAVASLALLRARRQRSS